MNLKTGLLGAILGVSVLASSAFAGDYSTMSTEELSKIRGAMQNAAAEERNAFQQEWQKRIQNMTQEEKQEYAGKPENAGKNNMMQNREMMQERIQERDTMQQRGNGMSGRMRQAFGGGRGGRR